MKQCIEHKYNVGTLAYNRRQLISVITWILWGSFCYDLLAYMLFPTLLPLSFKDLNASGVIIGIVLGSIPSAINFVLNPILSTMSDRTRSRFGRRLPYLLFATPFVSGGLIFIGWLPDLIPYVAKLFPGTPSSTLGLVALCIVATGFQLFSLIIGSISCYLPPDVVPKAFIGRLVAGKSIVLAVAGFIFNYFLMQYARNYACWLYTGIGLLFAFSFSMMCLMVKEGEYPPVEKVGTEDGMSKRTIKWLDKYFQECFCNRIFLMLFLGVALTQTSTICRGLFNILFATKVLALSEGQYGTIMGVGSLVSLGVVMVSGYFIDKCNALLLYIFSGIIAIIINIWGYFYTVDYASFFAVGIAIVVIYSIQGLSFMPMFVMLLPADKFGQFSSANAMLCCLIAIVANWGSGLAVDYFGYRIIFVWDFIFSLLSTIILFEVYFIWKKMGGRSHYCPPVVYRQTIATGCCSDN